MEFDFQYFLGIFFSGLTRGSIYALIALGYTMVYGIIGLINFAHGEIYMLGAFTALIVAGILGGIGLPWWGILVIAALVAMVWCSAYGYTVEKVAYKPLRGASRLAPLISAIGMSTFLQNYVQLAQTSNSVPFPRLIPRRFSFCRIWAISWLRGFHHAGDQSADHGGTGPVHPLHQNGQGHARHGPEPQDGHAAGH